MLCYICWSIQRSLFVFIRKNGSVLLRLNCDWVWPLNSWCWHRPKTCEGNHHSDVISAVLDGGPIPCFFFLGSESQPKCIERLNLFLGCFAYCIYSPRIRIWLAFSWLLISALLMYLVDLNVFWIFKPNVDEKELPETSVTVFQFYHVCPIAESIIFSRAA